MMVEQFAEKNWMMLKETEDISLNRINRRKENELDK